MSNTSQIVCGGGWNRRRVEKIKVKAWAMLFAAVLFGGVAVASSDSLWVYACVPAGASLLTSILFFIREKPRAVSFPDDPVGADLRKLHGASGQKALEKEKEG